MHSMYGHNSVGCGGGLWGWAVGWAVNIVFIHYVNCTYCVSCNPLNMYSGAMGIWS